MTEWVYGYHAVLAVLAAGRRRVHRVAAVSPERLPRSLVAQAGKCRIDRISPQELERHCPGAHPHDPIAQVDPYVYAEPVAIFKAATRTLLALDQIQDPHNLGALLRSAYALGVEGVLVSKDRSAEITPTVVRTSAGASELLAVCRVAGLPQQLETIKRRGFWIVGADMDGVPLGECRLWSEPIVVVMGAEGEGLRQTTRKVCDQLVRIPIRGSAVVDSLNVSVAGGILLWEVARAKAALPLG